MRRAAGFTLIELMIVVTIVGILAAIAMPQYQIYTGRAQISEALQLSEGLKSAIAERLQNGVPLASIDGGTQGMPNDVAANAGRYVESLVVAGGAVIATMKTTNVSPCVNGRTVTIQAVPGASLAAPVKWTCTSNSSCAPMTCS